MRAYARYWVARRDNFCIVEFRQTFNLLDIENRVALHVGDLMLDILAGLVVMLGASDGVGVDHERAFVALADMRVEFAGLAVGHPDGQTNKPIGLIRSSPRNRYRCWTENTSCAAGVP